MREEKDIIRRPSDPLVSPQESPSEVKEVETSKPNAEYVQGGPNNIRLSKSGEDQALEAGIHNVGMDSFILPNREQQLKGFWVDKPGVFVGQYRQYKFHYDKKEGKVPSISI